jgi:hypothetical protein
MGPTGCPETSVMNYHFSLRNDPEECGCHLVCGGSLKWRKMNLFHGNQQPPENVAGGIGYCLTKWF